MALNWTDFVWTIKRYISLYPSTFPGTWTSATIDFGSGKPKYDATFTITDANVTATSSVVVAPSGTVAAGRVGNDWEWDGLLLTALPAAGSFTLSAVAVPGPVVGKRTIQYQIR